MRNIIKSCFGKNDSAYSDYIKMLVLESDNYKKSFKIEVLKDKERDYFNFLIKSYENSKMMPNEGLFVLNFTETNGSFASAKDIPINDFRVYMFNFIDARVNVYISNRISEINKLIAGQGITADIADEFSKLIKLSNRNKGKDVNLTIDSKGIYNENKLKSQGMISGVKSIDEKIGGMSAGTVTTIAGFTSHFKTTFALNIAHINSYYFGYNIAYISLETPKSDMNWNLLSCHSYESHLSKFNFVSHDRMRKCILTPEEEDYVFDVVEPDLSSDMALQDGGTTPRGKVIILDESDFDTFSFGEILNVLDNLDRKLGGKLDAIVVDYIQLCKFSGSGFTNDANSQINSYVTFFRRLAQSFKKVKDPITGEEKNRMLITILLAQINRENWRRAKNNEGRYDLTCLADANELERGSYRVFTTYTNEEMKARKAAQVQILKNRTGQTMFEPELVFADPEAYVFCDEEGMSQTFGGDQTTSLGQAFSSLDTDFDFL